MSETEAEAETEAETENEDARDSGGDREIRTIAVAGAGTMGAGIAIVAARGGFETIVYDADEEALERAADGAMAFLQKSVDRGKLTQAQFEEITGRMAGATSLDELERADLVIEAVYEDLEVKRELFGDLHYACPPETLFASNTSTLSITELAAASRRADRFVGLHFCLPAQVMKLVEVTPGLATSDDTFQRAWDVCLAMGQQPVKTQDTPGFVLNYFVVPFNNDAIRTIEAGVCSPADLDTAIKKGMGYAMGPCELLDMIGLDTQILLSDAFYAATNDPRAACPPLLKRMVAAGHLGKKTGRGFYTYEDGKMFGA